MSFQDIFKSSFLENVGAVTLFDMVVALSLAFALGLFIFYVYKKTYAGVMYSASFGMTLIALTMITTLLILAVTSNVVLSLGMVGALSIVRFRTAIKEPSDIAFLFWAISVGIILAAGFIPLAVFGSFLLGIVFLVFSNYKTYERPYILIVHVDSSEVEKEVYEFLKLKAKKISLKSKSVEVGSVELNYEIRLKEENTDFVNELSLKEGVLHIAMVSYNGDYMN